MRISSITHAVLKIAWCTPLCASYEQCIRVFCDVKAPTASLITCCSRHHAHSTRLLDANHVHDQAYNSMHYALHVMLTNLLSVQLFKAGSCILHHLQNTVNTNVLQNDSKRLDFA